MDNEKSETRRNELKSMKLAKIHKVCEGYGVSINGTKFELIERIIRHEIKAKVEENEKKAQMEVMMSLKNMNMESAMQLEKNVISNALQSIITGRIEKCTRTGILDLSSCKDKCGANFNFRTISPEIMTCIQTSKIKEIWLSNNSLYTFPISICKIGDQITTLSLSLNHLHTIPVEIGLMKSLTRLIVSGNRLSSLPAEIKNLKCLKEFNGANNKFTKFPLVLTEIKSLRICILSNNFIDELPSDIQRLRNLVELDLDNNKISTVSGDIQSLKTSLRTLGLAGNLLETEPPAIKSLISLTVLRMTGNRASIFGPLTKRPDGYTKTNEKVKGSTGKYISVPVAGYVTESCDRNRDSGSWFERRARFIESKSNGVETKMLSLSRGFRSSGSRRRLSTVIGGVTVFETPNDIRHAHEIWKQNSFLENQRQISIGFVPTMGALHQGHLSLAKKAKEENDLVVASIFVNPKQFAAHEDLDKYPNTFSKDLEMLKSVGCTHVFAPNRLTMYPETPKYGTYINIEGIDSISEGAARPGFFRGVSTVVAKLFNIVQPTTAYFGQKDGLQCLVIKQLVRDLNMPINIKILPTSREKDGLAMSSRNVYLNKDQREVAPALYHALLKLEQKYKNGERDTKSLRKEATTFLDQYGEKIGILYISIADADTAEEVNGHISSDVSKRGLFVSGAIQLGKTRIIDNLIIHL